MIDVLENIVAHKREEVAAAKRERPIAVLQSAVRDQAHPRNFYQAVTRPGRYKVNLIAEVKRKSPSAGEIKAGEFNPAAIAQAYERGGASAISCLTDRKFFDGDLSYIRLIQDAVQLPVLRKDFVIDPYQVVESRAAGADAILLIAECLTQSLLCDLMIQAIEMKMTCLVEVYEAESLMRMEAILKVPHPKYTLLGINNRNLRTQTIDLAHTGRILSLMDQDELAPWPVVSESGVKTREDVQRLASYGVCALLVGETLMRAGDPEKTIPELFA